MKRFIPSLLICFSLVFGFNACKTLDVTQAPTLTEQNKGGTARFQAISVVNDQIIWTSGTQGTFARTSNGGSTWEVGKVPDADKLEFRDVQGIDANTAILMSAGEGANSRIYKTIDGGKNWALKYTNAEAQGFYDCMDFWDAQRGLLFSDSINGEMLVMQTSDGGATWTRIPPESLPKAQVNEGAFAASGTCVATRPNGVAFIGTGATSIKSRVLRTADYGKTWQVADSPIISDTPTAGITSVVMSNNQRGFIFGGDFQKNEPPSQRFARTVDGGKSWDLGANPPLKNGIFGGAHLKGSSALIVVGPKGANYSPNFGTTWQPISDGDFWSVGCGTRACWMVGAKTNIIKVSW